MVLFSPATIDRDGLHRCNLRGLARALERLDPAPDVALVDGFPLPDCARDHRAVVGGDHLSAAIAAASIVAKVTRDRVMRGLHASYPAYGFDHHVGYATAVHQTAICEHGVCELHRLSFASVAYQQLGLGLDASSRTADGTPPRPRQAQGVRAVRRRSTIRNVIPGPRSAPSEPRHPGR